MFACKHCHGTQVHVAYWHYQDGSPATRFDDADYCEGCEDNAQLVEVETAPVRPTEGHYCEVCWGRHVYVAKWVDVNTGVAADEVEGQQGWCEDCDTAVRVLDAIFYAEDRVCEIVDVVRGLSGHRENDPKRRRLRAELESLGACWNCEIGDTGDCPTCFAESGCGCPHGVVCDECQRLALEMVAAEVSK